MPFLRRLLLCLPLLLLLWHPSSHAKFKFGTAERLRHVANTTLTDSSGAKLYLARKIVEKHFLLPYSLEDQGYVLGVSGDSHAYYALPTGEKLAALQQAGHLPTPLPPYELDGVDWFFGHLLWFTLAGLVLYVGGHWAWGRRRAARTSTSTQALEPSFADTEPSRPASIAPAARTPAPPPLTVQLPLRLHPKRLKMLILLAGCLGFVALGALMFHDEPLIGALSIGFFGLGIPIAIVQMLPGAAFLELHADHFTFRAVFKQHSVRWRDIAGLRVVKVQGRAIVGWDFAPSYAGRGKSHTVSKAMAGIDAGLPDTYGMKPTALAELMDHIRLHHLHSEAHSRQPTPA